MAAVTAAVCTAVTVAPAAFAAPGDLDEHFGEGGIATPSFEAESGVLALHAEGRNVFAAAMHGSDGYTQQDALLAHFIDGRRDAAFGVRGGPGTYGNERPVGLASGPGRSVAAGLAANDPPPFGSKPPALVLVRFRPDGSPDSGFGDGGAVVYPGCIPVELIADSGGRLLVVGRRVGPDGSSEPALLRFLPDGQIDPSFGDGGTVVLSPSSDPRSIAAAPDGSVVVAGAGDPTVARYDAAGRPDPGFTPVRLFEDQSPGTHGPPRVVLDAQERIVVVIAGDGGHARLLRYLRDGRADAAFGIDGAAIAEGLYPTDLVFEGDHSLIVAGYAIGGGDAIARVARFTAGGRLDETFARDGFLRPVVEADSFVPPTVEPDGRGGLLIGGVAPPKRPYASDEGAFARYEGGGLILVTLSKRGVFSPRRQSVRLSARNTGQRTVRANLALVVRAGSRLIRRSKTAEVHLPPAHRKRVAIRLRASDVRRLSNRSSRRFLVRVRSRDAFGNPKESLERVAARTHH